MASIDTGRKSILTRYWTLIKSRQTLLLTLTGVAGFLSQQVSPPNWGYLSSLVGSLLITISGCSILNMVFDRDIDRMMERTNQRPLAAGMVNPATAAIVGGTLVLIGLAWVAALSWLYFLVVLAGAGLNLVVYTLWLKRRSTWSIVWGGIAGGMPILAGRVLAIGHIDLKGILLALIIVCWIPGHNLTLSDLYASDYITAGIPTFTNVYGSEVTYLVILISSMFTAFFMLAAFLWVAAGMILLILILLAGITLVILSERVRRTQARESILLLYKYSSIYMLASMLLLALNGIL